jgi:hypothetical protein
LLHIAALGARASQRPLARYDKHMDVIARSELCDEAIFKQMIEWNKKKLNGTKKQRVVILDVADCCVAKNAPRLHNLTGTRRQLVSFLYIN